jgi:superfamily II helicase
MNFTLDESYMCDISDIRTYSMYSGKDPDSLTPDEVVKILKGQDKIISHSNKDHPEFSKFREQLGLEGYIRIERGWWNGDRVTKPFTLNGVKFKVGDQFCSACAMKSHLEFERKYSECGAVW